MKGNMQPKRKYEFKKDKRWRKIRLFSAIALAVVLIIVGSVMLINSKLENKAKENHTLNAEGNTNSYLVGHTLEEADVYDYADEEDREVVITFATGEEFNIIDDEIVVGIDGENYVQIGFINEDGENNTGYIEVNKIEYIESNENDDNNNSADNQESKDINNNGNNNNGNNNNSTDTKLDDEELDYATPIEESYYTHIALNKEKITLEVGKIYTLKETATPTDVVDTISWSSSNTKVATVSSSGVVTAKSTGTAIITVANSNNTVTSTCEVTVKAKQVHVTNLTVIPKTLSLNVGKKSNIKYTISPSNAINKKVTFKSSNTKVATISAKGVVTAKQEGTTNITVTTVDNKKTQTIKVTVVKPKCKISSISSNNNILHYAVSCDKGANILTTKYSIADGSFIERDKTKIKSTKSDIIFKDSRVGKKITLRVYYGTGKNYSEKSIILGKSNNR